MLIKLKNIKTYSKIRYIEFQRQKGIIILCELKQKKTTIICISNQLLDQSLQNE